MSSENPEMSSQWTNLPTRLFYKISFFRSKSIVTNTNATAISLERIERVWVWALAFIEQVSFVIGTVILFELVSFVIGTVIFCFIVAVSYL